MKEPSRPTSTFRKSQMRKPVLICGVSGQDGGYLAKHLLGLGYEVWGSSRNTEAVSFNNLKQLGIFDSVRRISLDLLDVGAISAALQRLRPQQIYNLSGQTSVALSFQQPLETAASIANATINLLESVRHSGLDIRVYDAGSVEMFGDTGESRANEETRLAPRSPYAIAKASAYWTVSTYRKAYGMFACTGILSNHESPFRPTRFVTRKIVQAAAQISMGADTKLDLGNLDIERDWGWAPEYVEAIARMLHQPTPEDYIVATGQSCSLADFMETAFSMAGLNWRDHVNIDNQLKRPTDIARIRLDPSKAASLLGWRATYRMKDVAGMLLEGEIESLSLRKLAQATQIEAPKRTIVLTK